MMKKFLASAFVASLFVSGISAMPVSCVDTLRRLLGSISPKLEDHGWAAILQSCSEIEYETSIFVHKHVFVVSTPAVKGNTDCPTIAMEHSDLFAKPTDPHFGIRSVNAHIFTLPISDLPRLSLGTFPLSEIVKAFKTVQAEVASDTHSMKSYDIIVQNCGDFPARMMSLLRVEFDQEMVQYIAKRLQQTYRTIVRNVRTSPHAASLVTDNSTLDELTDLQLLELVVESKVKHLYDSSTTPLSDTYNDPSYGHRQRVLSRVDHGPTADERRLASIECGQWYSSGCLAESDVRYDPTASNAIADQNPAWKKFEGFYEATATAYGPDGRVIEPSFLEKGATTLAPNHMPYSQAPFKMFINITLSGSRLYEQMIAVFTAPTEAFCSQPVPEGMENVISSGECGWSGTSAFYERFGTSTFEKDGSVAMLPFGSTMSGTNLDRKSYVSLPAGDSNHFSSYLEGGVLVQYASACLDAECDQLSTTIDQYNTSTLQSEEYQFLASTRIFATRLASSKQFLDALEAAYLENNVPSDQRPFDEDGCLSGYCPEESDWCEYDPECAISPYLEPEAFVVAGPVIGFVVTITLIIFLALFALHRRQMKQKEAFVRAMLASRIAEGITVSRGSRALSPDQLVAEFHKIDQDNGGTLEKEELWAFLESGQVGSMTRNDFDLLFSVIDVDRSGNVDFNEFVAFYGSAMKKNGSKEGIWSDS
ncbi:unnamed protein product [Cylindrotheca closterium]|uniref:EF-hand domain-containing protein n=1 Tax=Cylindrotheca closterium TaxID=2856 RepID=A0AAD2GCP3_9STRA|nr:unnamed protein product [Cylindrotheca closterium]